MSNGYLTCCGLIISLLITMVFYAKESIKNIETKIFKKMLFINILESLTTTSIVVVALTINENWVFKLLNRIDVILIISWCSLLFYYIYNITIAKYNKKVEMFVISINIVMYFLALIFSVEIINQNGILDSKGPLTNLAVICAVFYIILILIIMYLTKNKKKNIDKKKYIPIYFLLILLGLTAFLRIIIPQVNTASLVFSLIDMLMLFTIENPDVRMIDELNMAKIQAEKANRAKSDFLSSMSHEIRTPLNAIVGFSECIVASDNLEEAKENASDIVSASNTLLEIVNGILDISKIEAGKLELINKTYSTKKMFDELVKLTKARIGNKPLEFRVTIAEDIPEVLYGDQLNVKKVIINLLTNAVKYTEKGFVSLNISCVKTDNVCRLIISVKDSGKGIKKEDIDKLFNKFQRVDEERNTTVEGTGLGLAITKQLVEMMNGKIVVDSVYGEGSNFTVALDQRMTNEKIVIEKSYDNENMDLTGKKILIVDDNLLNLKVAKKLLSVYNPIIETCESGMECLEKVKDNNYDLILLDDMMPKMRGTEVLIRLKQNPDFNIPVIALTANAINGMEEHYLKEGFNGYLAKPIEKQKLFNILNKYLVGTSVKIELKDYSNKKVLIVDDNNINIKITSKFLEPYHITVDTCNSGKECLEKTKDNDYDIIFMDIMMPDMDGVETFKQLKQNPNFNSKVITLTADAVSGAKEKYLGLGFDDYMAKPLLKEQLDEKLTKVFSNENVSNESNEIKKSIDVKSYLKNNNINIDHSLELLGDMETYMELLNEYLRTIREKANNLHTYKMTNDMENYAIVVHSLKSDSRYLGFDSLADMAYEHELKSKANDSEFVNNNFDKLINELNKVLTIVLKLK